MRLLILSPHVVQYKAPLYQMLAADPRFDLEVVYCSTRGARAGLDPDLRVEIAWNLDLLTGYPHHFLRNLSFSRRGLLRYINPGIVPRLFADRWDAVLFHTGWGSVTAWLAIVSCLVSRTPILMFGDSSTIPPEHGIRGRMRAAVLRGLFRRIARFMTIGTLNSQYYRHYGADPSRMIRFPYAIDVERFETKSRLSLARRFDVRARYGIGRDEIVILFAGKLIERKGPRDLLDGFLAIDPGVIARRSLRLVFAGEGELRTELEKRSHGHRVTFTGFVNQAEFPELYGSSNLFVLPSREEPWGLVVNEAMACGLPVLVSESVGAGVDLVTEAENGYRFPAGNVRRLTEMLVKLTADPGKLQEMGEASRSRIQGWTYRQDVDALLEAVRQVAR